MTAVRPLRLEPRRGWLRTQKPELRSWARSRGETVASGTLRMGAGAASAGHRATRAREVAQELFLAAMRALCQALEAKDPYTWGHSMRVSALGAAMAAELGLCRGERADIRLGGELHDVGKIGVPDDLLHKEGPLTPDEYRRVMQHPLIGERILAPLIHHRPTVLHIVRSHHERMDGRGLPDGLAGEDIPLAARIIAVADAFDAMTSHRSYRSSLPVSAAILELEINAGIQFDAECVGALERVLPGLRWRSGETVQHLLPAAWESVDAGSVH
ncbi:MAG: HD-GYP domain-containing protein [Gemmatimonadales bacterium]|nr:HD-GYP domain-containing protein [Gemmatimonadales bacterium]